MSKRGSIRWSDNDHKEIRRAVKNFNAKITRLEKKIDKIISFSTDTEEIKRAKALQSALPERVTTKEILSLIGTRNDLNRELNTLRRFSSDKKAHELVDVPDNKYNLQITRWQKREMSIRKALVNRGRKKKKEELFNIEMTSRSESLGYTVGEFGMGEADKIALNPAKAFTHSMDREDINRRYKSLRKESTSFYWDEKTKFLRDNVVNGIEANYSSLFPDDVEKIKSAIFDMDFNEFYNTFKSSPNQMEEVSPKPGTASDQLMKQNIESLKATWIPNYKKGK